jgi:hypothetical protein
MNEATATKILLAGVIPLTLPLGCDLKESFPVDEIEIFRTRERQRRHRGWHARRPNPVPRSAPTNLGLDNLFRQQISAARAET